MTQIAAQIEQFREFALAQLSDENKELTIDELYDEWRILNPDPVQMTIEKNAVAASLRDYRNGVSGKPAAEVIRRLKSQLPNE
jgi:hypothetical protein